MPLSSFQQQAAELVFSDRSALLDMAKHVKRLNPTVKIPELEMDEQVQERVNSQVEPLKKELEELQKKYANRESVDARQAQWALMKGPPFNYSDEKIRELETRMGKDAEKGDVLFSSYTTAAQYYNRMDSPLTPSGGNQLGISRHNKSEDTWRKDIQDPKSPLRGRNRKASKDYARNEWNKVRQEIGK